MKITVEMLPLIRASRGLTQSEFAKEMSVPQSSLSDIETGRVELSEHYEKKVRKALSKLEINKEEMRCISLLARLNQFKSEEEKHQFLIDYAIGSK